MEVVPDRALVQAEAAGDGLERQLVEDPPADDLARGAVQPGDGLADRRALLQAAQVGAGGGGVRLRLGRPRGPGGPPAAPSRQWLLRTLCITRASQARSWAPVWASSAPPRNWCRQRQARTRVSWKRSETLCPGQPGPSRRWARRSRNGSTSASSWRQACSSPEQARATRAWTPCQCMPRVYRRAISSRAGKKMRVVFARGARGCRGQVGLGPLILGSRREPLSAGRGPGASGGRREAVGWQTG